MGVDRPIDITGDQKKTLLALLKRYLPNTTAWVYGSRVKWTSRPQSDLDLVVFTTPDQERRVSDLREAFEESNLPFRVDLFVWDAVPEQFRKQIEAEHVVLVEKEEQGAVSEWTRKTLGALTENFDAVRVPIKQADRRPGPYPYYGASGIVDSIDDYLFNGEYLLIAEDGENLRTRNTSIAFLANGKFWVNNHAHIVRGNHEANTRYLMYALSELDISGYLTGSTMPKLTQGNMNQISLLTPPPHEQRAIAHVLGTLDDKIELNRRMNETLEAMARALFKSWFIDFDPVRAKMAGRDPGLPQHLADLFPDRMVDSEIGEIPKGWKVGALGDVLFQRVERCRASQETASRPYVPIDCISSKSLFLTESKSGEEAKSSLTKFYTGDLIFGAMRPYYHKVCIAPFDGTTRTTAFVLYPTQKHDFAFATLLLHDSNTIDFATRNSTGSTIPYAVWTDSLEAMATIIPTSGVLNTFNDTVRPLLIQISQTYFESRTLAILRDALLPKLISGELRAKNAERLIEEAKS